VVIGQNNSESVWRKASEKWKPYCLNQHKMKTKVSCMFWGCITVVLDHWYQLMVIKTLLNISICGH
jgi:hypothetical protein